MFKFASGFFLYYLHCSLLRNFYCCPLVCPAGGPGVSVGLLPFHLIRFGFEPIRSESIKWFLWIFCVNGIPTWVFPVVEACWAASKGNTGWEKSSFEKHLSHGVYVSYLYLLVPCCCWYLFGIHSWEDTLRSIANCLLSLPVVWCRVFEMGLPIILKYVFGFWYCLSFTIVVNFFAFLWFLFYFGEPSFCWHRHE